MNEKNINKSLIWINFYSIIMPTQSFWLKIRRKEQNDFPISVKSSTKKSHNITTTSEEANYCHYTSASDLLAHPHRDKERLAIIPLVDEVTYGNEYPISLCDGISGLVPLPDGKNLVRIESTSDHNSATVLLTQIPKLSHDDLTQLKDYHQLKNAAESVVQREDKLQRAKRSFKMPVYNMPGPFLVELYLVVDSKMASLYHGYKYARLLARIKTVMTHINVAYMQFNIYFTVVHLEIWERDQIKLTEETHIITELQMYKRQNLTIRHDCLHAILGENFGTGRRGQSERASMCALSRCVGYTKDFRGLSERELAHSMMHELGHNFGLTHDTERCQCYGCIMATGVEFGNLKFQWSNCSLYQMTGLLQAGMSECLRDQPATPWGNIMPVVIFEYSRWTTLDPFDLSQCGNGVVDAGEECDCGGRDHCNEASNRCCDPDTCRLRPHARCASGVCCDLTRCAIKPSGTVCRSSERRECDLEEYCNGVSEWCPDDVYKYDGFPCRNYETGDWSHCYRGQCHSRHSWCRVLYGTTAKEASSNCYDMNGLGDAIKNCGSLLPEDINTRAKYWTVRKCDRDQLMCGRLWCEHTNERVLRPSPMLEIDEDANGNQCSAARFYPNTEYDDAGLVPRGSSCGRGKMCWDGYCIPTVYRKMGAACFCHGHGVCNNRQHCHCDRGFAPDNCTMPGDGGSLDSGPPPKYHLKSLQVIAGTLIIVVLVVMILAITILLYHYNTRRWPPFFVKVKLPGYQMLSRTFKGYGIGSSTCRKSPQRCNKSSIVIITEQHLESDKIEEKSDSVLRECLKRISSDAEQLSMDELKTILDNVFMKQTDPVVADQEQNKTTKSYTKFALSATPHLTLSNETKYHSNGSVQSPIGSPTTMNVSPELNYANNHQSAVRTDKSPPLRKTPMKPTPTKTKALMFENKKIALQSQNPAQNDDVPLTNSRPNVRPNKSNGKHNPSASDSQLTSPSQSSLPTKGTSECIAQEGNISQSKPQVSKPSATKIQDSRPSSQFKPPISNLVQTKATVSRPLQSKFQDSKALQSKPQDLKPLQSKVFSTNVSITTPKVSKCKSQDSKISHTKPQDSALSQTKPQNSALSQTKPLDAKSSQSKTLLTNHSQTKPAVSKPLQYKSPDSTSSQSKPTDSTPSQMKPIDSKLSKGKPPVTSPKPVKPDLAPKPTVSPLTDSTAKPVIVVAKPPHCSSPPPIAPWSNLLSAIEPDIARKEQPPGLPSSQTTKATKDQISQPRLDQTTCTIRTRDLPVPDQTLARQVLPHKVIKVDPNSAVKFMH